MLKPEEGIKLSNKKINAILGDAEKSAKVVNLVYVHDKQPGIKRRRKGTTFVYYLGKHKITDASELERIKKLVIPPAWEDVWICSLANGHLQATGKDIRQRKQYKYHPLWSSLRNHTKFYRLHEFGKAMPMIRRHIKQDLALPGLPAEKVLATVVCLMEQTSIRVGNNAYEKLYGSFGLTTLKNQHVKITGGNMRFMFKGKKGIGHNISVTNKRLARIVKNCRDIPGKELFQYYDDEGNHKSIDSGMINAYLKAITRTDFTAKDFRTWSGSVRAISAFREAGYCEKKADIQKNIVAALDSVAEHLGNTRSVCKKYYVHPVIIDLYENQKLHTYLEQHRTISTGTNGLSCEEQLLMDLLEKEGMVCARSFTGKSQQR